MERDGVNYHFVATDTFLAMAGAGEFLEHAEVFGHHYGTSATAVDVERAGGRDVILEIDFQGAAQVRQRYPEAVSVFILPPSAAALQNRLTSRGQDDEGVIAERLDKARWEMSHYRDYDYLLVNDDFDVCLADLMAIVRSERLRLARQESQLAALLNDLLNRS
jgi:guanylate kinase